MCNVCVAYTLEPMEKTMPVSSVQSATARRIGDADQRLGALMCNVCVAYTLEPMEKTMPVSSVQSATARRIGDADRNRGIVLVSPDTSSLQEKG